MKQFLVAIMISLVYFLGGLNLSLAYEKEISALSTLMAENISRTGKKTIAVVDFVDLQGNVTELGRFMAEEISVALASAGKGFEVVDRTHLKSLLVEHKLISTGLIDPQTARKLGQIAGVGALVTGSITPFGDSIRLSVKILDTSTAKVIGASSGNIAKTKAIEELLGKGIESASASSSVPTTRESSIRSPIVPGAGKAYQVEGFVFRPVKCWRSVEKVICSMSIQNTGNETVKIAMNGSKIFTEYPKSHFYDNHGNQYSVEVQLGDGREKNSIEANILPQIPINFNFIAESVRPEASQITLVIGMSKFDGRKWLPQKLLGIKDIPITK